MKQIKRTGRIAVVFIAIVSAMVLHGCSPVEKTPLSMDIEFERQGVRIAFDKKTVLDEVKVMGPSGDVIISKKYFLLEMDSVALVFVWKPAEEYVFVIKMKNGVVERKVVAPEVEESPVSVEIFLPYGGADKEIGTVRESSRETVVSAGGVITGAIVFTSYLSSVVEYDCILVFPGGIDFSGGIHSEDSGDGSKTIRIRKELDVPYESYYEQFEVGVPNPGEYRLEARVEVNTGIEIIEIHREIILKVESREEIMSGVVLEKTIMPTRLDGQRDDRKRQDAIYVKPDVFKKIGRIFGIVEKYDEPYVPSTYQSIVLRSNTETSVSYLIESDILYKNRDETPEYFYPPDEYLGGRKDISVIVATTLMPGETTGVVLPIFIGSPPPPGEYRRRIRIIPMGTKETVAEYELPLYVTSMNVPAFVFTSGAVVVSVFVAGFLVFGFSGLVSAMKIRWIVIVALYGAMTFVVLNVPIRIFGAVLSAISGPFGVFVTGIFSDMLYLILLVSLVRSIPRPGIITLAIIIRYILNGIFFGGVQFSDILFNGVSIAAMETAFYAAGVTRKGDLFKWTALSTVITALCLSIANVLLILTNIYLFMALFRLFYAQWYIILNVLINGILYTWIAVYMGKRFSDKLKWADV